MKIEIAVVTEAGARHEAVEVAPGATVADALAVSALAAEADATGGKLVVAMHGALAEGSRRLEEGDRIDLLPELPVAPVDARRRRAEAEHGAERRPGSAPPDDEA